MKKPEKDEGLVDTINEIHCEWQNTTISDNSWENFGQYFASRFPALVEKYVTLDEKALFDILGPTKTKMVVDATDKILRVKE